MLCVFLFVCFWQENIIKHFILTAVCTTGSDSRHTEQTAGSHALLKWAGQWDLAKRSEVSKCEQSPDPRWWAGVWKEGMVLFSKEIKCPNIPTSYINPVWQKALIYVFTLSFLWGRSKNEMDKYYDKLIFKLENWAIINVFLLALTDWDNWELPPRLTQRCGQKLLRVLMKDG